MPITLNGVPYPDPTEPVAQGAVNMKALADAIDPLTVGPWIACTNGAGLSGTVYARKNGYNAELVGVLTGTIGSTILTLPAALAPLIPAPLTQFTFLCPSSTTGSAWLSVRVWANRNVTSVTNSGSAPGVDLTVIRYPIK